MSEPEAPNETQAEARTPRKTPETGSVQADRDRLTAGFAELAARLAGVEQQQPDLLDGSPDLEPHDLLSLAANRANEGRRARGRPHGSQNRRNADVFDYLAALGHRDPAVTLSLFQSADVGDLAFILGCDKAEAAALQLRAAAELMPYKYAKRPQAVEVTKKELHLFMAGTFDMAAPADMGGALDLTNGAEQAGPVIDNDVDTSTISND